MDLLLAILSKLFQRLRIPRPSPAPGVLIMALGDIKISWTNPTKTVGGGPANLTKVRIYEMQPGNSTPQLAKELTAQADIAAQTFTLVDYYQTARVYSFVVSFVNADGESALSPVGSDSVDVPQAGGAPVVAILPKP